MTHEYNHLLSYSAKILEHSILFSSIVKSYNDVQCDQFLIIRILNKKKFKKNPNKGIFLKKWGDIVKLVYVYGTLIIPGWTHEVFFHFRLSWSKLCSKILVISTNIHRLIDIWKYWPKLLKLVNAIGSIIIVFGWLNCCRLLFWAIRCKYKKTVYNQAYPHRQVIYT